MSDARDQAIEERRRRTRAEYMVESYKAHSELERLVAENNELLLAAADAGLATVAAERRARRLKRLFRAAQAKKRTDREFWRGCFHEASRQWEQTRSKRDAAVARAERAEAILRKLHGTQSGYSDGGDVRWYAVSEDELTGDENTYLRGLNDGA